MFMFNGGMVRFGIDVPKVVTKKVHFNKLMSIQQRFEAFHEANPSVYHALVRMAWQMKQMGYNGSIDLLYSLLRVVNGRKMETQTDGFAISDNFRSRYSRLLMEQETGLAEFFATKTLSANEDVDDEIQLSQKTELIWDEYEIDEFDYVKNSD